ncbi:MAG: Asp-tRNA(Asn)/Glu-tRNA(Gln) amidotransferase subunit GatC [Brevinematia bacterium]
MITREVIAKVADLSRLRFNDDELESFVEEFSNIVSFVGMINELDTSDVDPSPYPIDIINEPREDIVVSSSEKVSKILENSPKRKGNFIVVPRVIER